MNLLYYDILFRCCINPRCTKKKLNESFLCTNCHVQYSAQSAGNAAVSKCLIKTKDKNQTFTCLTDVIIQPLDALKEDTSLTNQNNVMESFKRHLPIQVAFTYRSDKIISVRLLLAQNTSNSRPDKWPSVGNLKTFFSRKRSNALLFKMGSNRSHPSLHSISALTRGRKCQIPNKKQR